jgi:hypothetical protein
MRLIASGHVVNELNYEEAPAFKGSAGSVTCDRSPAWEVTGPLLAAAGIDTPGEYDLRWLIYRGSGDMVYRARCAGQTLEGTYRDRRSAGIGGGFGTFETTDFIAARIKFAPTPYPFWLTTSLGGIEMDCDGRVRDNTDYQAGARVWPHHDQALSWSTNGLYLGGRLLHIAQTRICCAALYDAPEIPEIPATDSTPAVPAVPAGLEVV